ncbi:MAG: T9SS type A sorting domain-containing protein, partial [Bacteroidota bacterium]
AVIIEDSLYGTSSQWGQTNYYSGGSNGPMCGFESKPATIPAAQMHYDHVGRAILDSPYGTVGSITQPVISGSVHSYHYTYTIPASWNYDKLQFIGLLMDETSGVILNANNEVIWVGTSELNNDLRLRVFPNPVAEKATVQFTLDKAGTINIKVYDLPGNCLIAMKPSQFQSGNNKVDVDVRSLRQGFYFVEVSVDGHTNTQKIVVTR